MFTRDEISDLHRLLKHELPNLLVHLSNQQFGYVVEALWFADVTGVSVRVYAWIDRQARYSARTVVRQRRMDASVSDGTSQLMLDADWSEITMDVRGPIWRMSPREQDAWREAFGFLAERHIKRLRRRRQN